MPTASPRRAPAAPTAPAHPAVRAGALLVVAVALTALNLRTAVTSVGPVLEELRTGVGMSGAVAGLLTSIPVLCFAGVGFLAPAAARRLGPHGAVAVALALMAAGVVLRAAATVPLAVLACTLLALVGGGVGNVLLPMIVKLHFPGRVGLLTAVYTTALAVGATAAAALTVPLAELAGDGDAADGWRVALGVWALPALAAAVAWVVVVLRRRAAAGVPAGATSPATQPLHPARTVAGRALAAYFGSQALLAYVTMGWLAQFFRDAGASASTAGYLLAFTAALSVPVSMVVPQLAARRPSQRVLVAALVLGYLLGYAGLVAAPLGGAWLWALLIGLGSGSFPLALTFIGLRSSTPAETASLSAFAQSTGYLLATPGPLLIGWLHGAGGWAGPFAVIVVALVVQLVAGLHVGGPARESSHASTAGPSSRRLL
ncbi:MFS transporter [Motilibacter aurantiacus]|uniref:MFS transporter n=1 Tax=Motilibacter aurantiacus TaxID=2714955 RepID=UPI0038B31CA0